ncbi:hypothetical protein ACFWXK_38080 [Streptomyces sp. NPDC059070]|uniref:hypothetical protein n=1 Tax=Streptomyces sp. NPDC059070 TaxID=3346713 RepID=UPI00369CFEFE
MPTAGNQAVAQMLAQRRGSSPAPTRAEGPAVPVAAHPGALSVQRAPAEGGKRERSGTVGEPSGAKRPKQGGEGGSGALLDDDMDIDMDMTIDDLLEMGAINARDVVLSQQKFIDALVAKARNSSKWQLHTAQNGGLSIETKVQGKPKPNSTDKGHVIRGLESVATVARSYLADTSEEVQAAIGDNGMLLIAANRAFSNETLAAGLGKGGGEEFAAFVDGAGATTDKQSKRQKKVQNILAGIEKTAGRYDLVRSAVSKGVVVASNGGNELHAEIRILERNGRTPQYVAGTKRPCAACFTRLYPKGNDNVRPGVLYLSGRSLASLKEFQTRYGQEEQKAAEFFARMDQLIKRTHQSVDEQGTPQPGGAATDWEDSGPE